MEYIGTPVSNENAQSYDVGANLVILLHEVRARKNSAVGDVLPRQWAVLATELEKSLGYYQAFLQPKPINP